MADSFFVDFQSGADKAYVPYSLDAFERGLRICLDKGIISPGTIFLDLGAGKGRVVIEAARYGFYAYGIEYHQQHVFDAEQKIRVARRSAALGESSICRVVQGSYYPRAYIALRDRREAIALQHEDLFFDVSYSDPQHASSFSLKTRARVFYPVASDNDPFAEVGVSFRDISVFFSYTWGVELPSQLEIFSRYAHPDALFLNETAEEPEKHQELLDALRLKQEPLGVSSHRRACSGTTAGLMVYRRR